MVNMRGGAMAVILQSQRFYNCWRAIERRNVNFLCSRFVNLQRESRWFGQNVNRCMSLANLPVPEVDIKKFLDHLVDASINRKSTPFDELLENHLIRRLINERITLLDNNKSLMELENEDKEMKQLAKEEKLVNEVRINEIDDELISVILNNIVGHQFDDVIMEITAGVGGQESMLFTRNLFEMYINHFAHLGYSYDIIEIDDAEQGGARNVSISISGKYCYSKLQHEAGVHRVQRIPVTEKSGRIHTSTVSIAVLPQPSEIHIEINPGHLKIDTMRATGAGGQHVNTTNSAVRITHLPTGIVVTCQEDKSQIKNRKLAMGKLRAKLFEQQLTNQLKNTSNLRKQQKGLGQRNEKIRTYNFPQDRVTDHRISNGTMHNIKGFLSGGKQLDDLHNKLQLEMQRKLFIEALNSVMK